MDTNKDRNWLHGFHETLTLRERNELLLLLMESTLADPVAREQPDELTPEDLRDPNRYNLADLSETAGWEAADHSARRDECATFDAIVAYPPLRNADAKEPAASGNNARYVDALFRDAEDSFQDMIATLKRDVSNGFPFSQTTRLRNLLCIYRAAWQGLEGLERDEAFPDQRQWLTLEEAAARYELLEAYIQGKMDGRKGWTKVAGHVRLYSVLGLEKVKGASRI